MFSEKIPLRLKTGLFLLLSNTGEDPRGKQIMPLSINDSLFFSLLWEEVKSLDSFLSHLIRIVNIENEHF